jgi:hypothetical protein
MCVQGVLQWACDQSTITLSHSATCSSAGPIGSTIPVQEFFAVHKSSVWIGQGNWKSNERVLWFPSPGDRFFRLYV